MRLTSLDCACWGPLQARRFDLSDRVFLVYGANEAGKSSFRSAVETLLYGFSPAQRDAHPLATWNADASELHLEAELVLDGGERMAVERHMQSRGTLRVAPAGEPFEGRRSDSKNAPLPQLAAIPRELFRAVYCLTTGDVVELEGDVRRHVDELLLGEKGVAGLRSTHAVREELREAMGRLWRPTDVGKPRAKELRAELREARRGLREARREELELRALVEENARLEDELDELKVRRRALEREAEEARFLAAVSELRQRAAQLPALNADALAGEPLVDPVELETAARRLTERLAEPRARLARTPLALPSTAREVLALEQPVRAALEDRARHALERESEADARAGAAELEREVRAGLARLVGLPPGEVATGALAAFPLDGLRATAEAWREELEERRARGVRPPAWLVLAAAVGAGVALAALADVLPPLVGALGIAMTATALFVAVARTRAEETESAPRADALRLLAHLAVDPSAAPTPAALARLVERLEDQRAKLETAHRANARAAEFERACAQREAGWRALAERAGYQDATRTSPSRGAGPASHTPAAELLDRLADDVARAREQASAARADAAERERCAADLATREPELARLTARLERVLAALCASFPHLAADPAAAHAAWREAEREAEFVRRREAELAADPRFARLKDDPRLAAPEPVWHPHVTEARDAELAEIETRLEAANRRLGELAQKLEADEGSRVARATERVAELESEYAELCRVHDRLALLERVLTEADRLHREEHQPDVLRRASRYLEAITAGRYTRLDYAAGEEAGLHVVSTERDEPAPVGEPLSRGTRDQIYLCLRLGLLDHLDVGRESLPLVLDETLVHWDAARRAELYPVLAEVAGRRQVILFTCHASFADEAQRAMELVRIDLSEVAGRKGAPRTRRRVRGGGEREGLFPA